MEDYKEKYEQAILRMNKWVEGSEIIDPKEVAEFVFPELKKSEEEKTKKSIITHLRKLSESKVNLMTKATYEEWISWLENTQSNPYSGASFEYNGHTWGICARDGGVEVTMDSKIVSSVDKDGKITEHTSPNFRVGDLIAPVNPTGHQCPVRITEIYDRHYTCNSDDGKVYIALPFSMEDDYRIVEENHASGWTENDSKHVQSILKRLDGMCRNGATFTQTHFAVSEDIDWLKSLQKRW